MCKSAYNSKQVGIFNLQLTSISIPWLLIGGLIIGSIWFSVCLCKHCRRRSKRQVLRQRNLETLNNRMSMISMGLPNQFQFPVAPVSQPTVQQNPIQFPPTYAPPDYPISLKLNSAVVWVNQSSSRTSRPQLHNYFTSRECQKWNVWLNLIVEKN